MVALSVVLALLFGLGRLAAADVPIEVVPTAEVRHAACAAESRASIGVLVVDGEHDAPERWSPTADYLSRQVPPQRFVIVPLDRQAMRRAVAHDELDFILANPSQYVELAATHAITALATMSYAWQGKSYSESSAAIIARADRQDIRRLSDLRGKSFMAVSPDAFEGPQIIDRELRAHGIDPSRDFSRLIFSGSKHEQSVDAVHNRTADAAAVRAGILERLTREGKIHLMEFRVPHQHGKPLEFPFATSTEVYPERPFAQARKTPDKLAQQVASALKAMPVNHPVARAVGYTGWTAARYYRPVEELLAGFAFMLLLAGATAYTVKLNFRLKASKDSLETEIIERKHAEQQLRRSAQTLRALHDITSMHDLSSADRIRALLTFGCKQFGLPVGMLSRVQSDRYEVVEVVAPDASIARGSIFPLGHTYCCNTLQSDEPLSFEHAAESKWQTHPAYDQRRLEAYLGIRVEVDGAVYGTLNFVSREPRTVMFTPSDRETLKLMALWVGSELERQYAEAEMRKLSGALAQTADAVTIVSLVGLIEYVNPAFEQITGYRRDEVIGRTPALLKSGRHGAEFYEKLWQTILNGQVFHATFTNQRKDGSLYYEEKSITPLKDAAGQVTCFVTTGKDVTRRMLAEERARHRQAEIAHVCRVSAMGEMATALAHELNQPLAAIVNYAQGSLHRLRAGDAKWGELQFALEHIAALGNQSGEIVRRTRGFLRKGDAQRTRADINGIVQDSVELANLMARQKAVTLRLKLANELPPVSADVIQIEQVVLNLVHNAIEAIDAARTPQREVTIQTARSPSNGVDVMVSDSGPGLPTGDFESIFEPFFTTKLGGMGMGLSISRSIIETYGEQLRAAANPEGGTTFYFSLPAAEEVNAS
jgi:PAS domain S-box-containing protein